MYNERIELGTCLPDEHQKESNLYALYRCCMYCGSTFVARWFVPVHRDNAWIAYQVDSSAFDEYSKEAKQMATEMPCPVCDASIVHSLISRGYFEKGRDKPSHYSFVFNGDYEFGSFRRKVLKFEKDDARKKVEQHLKEWDSPVVQSNNHFKDQICISPKKLEDYLSQLIRLEVNIYSLTQRLDSLYLKRTQIEKTYRRELAGGETVKALRDALAEAEADLEGIRQEGVKVTYPTEPEPPVLKRPGLFNKSKVLADNEAAQTEYNTAMAEYKRQVEACQAEERRLTEQAISTAVEKVRAAQAALKTKQAEMKSSDIPSAALARSADHEIEEAEKCLKDTLKTRNELYSYNVVFGKYRDLVAISTFYEYLMAGRCTALEGADGAYNIYEAEIRANMIISQLTVIIQKLEDIKANQYMLYSELTRVNQNLSQISKKMDSAIEALNRIGDNTEQIAYNTEVTAFYAKKNAELTDALGYMVAFK